MVKPIINTKIKILSIVLGMVAVIAIILFAYSRNDKQLNPYVANTDNTAKTTSTAETAQENFTNGTERPIETSDPNKGQATINDNSGYVATIPDASEWISSPTNEIVVYTPSNNQLLETGSSISGASELKNVSFRIIDNVSGVIAEGQLSVVSGKYSGKINYTTNATEGRLDIFGTKDDGVEFSNIEIPIRFK